jgi:hypothetical protein
VTITGSATLAGTLNVTLVNGFVVPHSDISFTLMSFASVTGSFSTIAGPRRAQASVTSTNLVVDFPDLFVLYVTSLYRTVLNRTPAVSEVTPWMQFLETGG